MEFSVGALWMKKQYLVSKTSQNIMADLRFIMEFKTKPLSKSVELKLVPVSRGDYE